MSDLPTRVPVIPIRAGFYFPGVKVPLSAGRKRSVAALVEACKRDGYILLIHQKETNAPEPPPEAFPTMGTLGRVAGEVGDKGRWSGSVYTMTRAWVGGWHKSTTMLMADITPIPSRGEAPETMSRLRAAMIRSVELDPEIPDDAAKHLLKVPSLSLLTDIGAQNSDLSRPEKQRLLETASAVPRAASLVPYWEAHAATLSGAPPPVPDPPPPAPQDDLGAEPSDPLQRVRYHAALLARCGGLPPVGVVEVAMEQVENEDEQTRKIARRLARQAADDRRTVEDRWPLRTDHDRLDEAFVALNRAGIAARHDWGLNHDDGLKLFDQEFRRRKHSDRYRGLLFYHHQQVRAAAMGRGLQLDFEALRGNPLEIGREIVAAIRAVGLPAYWSEDPFAPIDVPIRWQRRMPPDPF